MNWPLIIAIIVAWLALGCTVAYVLFALADQRGASQPLHTPEADAADLHGRWGVIAYPLGVAIAITASALWPMGFAS